MNMIGKAIEVNLVEQTNIRQDRLSAEVRLKMMNRGQARLSVVVGTFFPAKTFQDSSQERHNRANRVVRFILIQ